MRVIAKSTLKEFYQEPKYADSQSALESWHQEMSKSNFSNSNEIKEKYRNCSVVGDNKIVFNISGNKYRLIVKINYFAKIIYIKFVGTHKQYDKIDIKEL